MSHSQYGLQPQLPSIEPYRLLPPKPSEVVPLSAELGVPDFWPHTPPEERIDETLLRKGYDAWPLLNSSVTPSYSEESAALDGDHGSLRMLIYKPRKGQEPSSQSSQLYNPRTSLLEELRGELPVTWHKLRKRQKRAIYEARSGKKRNMWPTLQRQRQTGGGGSWLDRLQDGDETLRNVAYDITHGKMGKSLINGLLDKQVPLIRSAWCIKLIYYAPSNRKNRAQVSKDLTKLTTEILDEQLRSFRGLNASAFGPRVVQRWRYLVRLAHWHYQERIINRDAFLAWLADVFEKHSDKDQYALTCLVMLLHGFVDAVRASPPALVQVSDIITKRLRSHHMQPSPSPILRSCYRALVRIHDYLTIASTDAMVTIAFASERIVRKPCVAVVPGRSVPGPSSVLAPTFALTRSATQSHHARAVTASTILARELVLERWLRPRVSQSDAARAPRLLDEALEAGNLAPLAPVLDAASHDHAHTVAVLEICFDWVVAPHRHLHAAGTVAAVVVSRLASRLVDPQATVQGLVHRALATVADQPESNATALYVLLGSLERAGLFSHGLYLRYMISRGVLETGTSEAREAHRRHLLNSPVLETAGTAQLNQRRALLFGVSGKVADQYHTAQMEICEQIMAYVRQPESLDDPDEILGSLAQLPVFYRWRIADWLQALLVRQLTTREISPTIVSEAQACLLFRFLRACHHDYSVAATLVALLQPHTLYPALVMHWVSSYLHLFALTGQSLGLFCALEQCLRPQSGLVTATAENPNRALQASGVVTVARRVIAQLVAENRATDPALVAFLAENSARIDRSLLEEPPRLPMSSQPGIRWNEDALQSPGQLLSSVGAWQLGFERLPALLCGMARLVGVDGARGAAAQAAVLGKIEAVLSTLTVGHANTVRLDQIALKMMADDWLHLGAPDAIARAVAHLVSAGIADVASVVGSVVLPALSVSETRSTGMAVLGALTANRLVARDWLRVRATDLTQLVAQLASAGGNWWAPLVRPPIATVLVRKIFDLGDVFEQLPPEARGALIDDGGGGSVTEVLARQISALHLGQVWLALQRARATATEIVDAMVGELASGHGRADSEKAGLFALLAERLGTAFQVTAVETCLPRLDTLPVGCWQRFLVPCVVAIRDGKARERIAASLIKQLGEAELSPEGVETRLALLCPILGSSQDKSMLARYLLRLLRNPKVQGGSQTGTDLVSLITDVLSIHLNGPRTSGRRTPGDGAAKTSISLQEKALLDEYARAKTDLPGAIRTRLDQIFSWGSKTATMLEFLEDTVCMPTETVAVAVEEAGDLLYVHGRFRSGKMAMELFVK